ncbi:GTP-binding protein [Baffinella frigidus]|nr:GTP-binding protein [Cryptophyta sp. CCMP2293]|mmetsp:Transcript_40769/g.96525  ORF Transcript_40769/g.96525 Transcript_40769/m.96525 type:complete len:180 (+) Transcript_40769:59-598(+)
MWLWSWIASLLQALGLSSKEAKIVILGLDNAGKSTLLHKMCNNEVRSFVPTVKAHSRTFSLGRVNFTAWDLGGHEQVRDLWEEYYSSADAMVFMVDCADAQRFDEARVELSRLLKVEEAADVPVLILANKSDVEGSKTRHEVMQALDVDDLDRDLEVFSCSLVTGGGYIEAFRWLTARL